jgi:hypothetical protein
MRLINIKAGQRMSFEEFNEPEVPKYAILSHTWRNEEVSYAEVSASFSSLLPSSTSRKAGFEKIRQFAAQARLLGFDYIWVDTCK